MKRAILIAATLLWACSAALAAEDSSSLDTIEQRAQPCMACHGKEGRATSDGYFPRIAGKPAGYLFNQLINFREGRRHFPMMAYLTDRQDEAYLMELAGYFGGQELPYASPTPPHVSPDVLDWGHKLVFEGDPTRKIPACKSCHGARLVGVAPAVPGLLGLSQDYLLAQLGAWQNRSRHANAPDCMADIVRDLGPRDINAVSAWLSTQIVPVDSKADKTFENTPPRNCGSISQAMASP